MPAVVPRSARPDARPEISPDALLVPLAPHEAYAADIERLDGRAPLGAADDAWLMLAHTLERAAALPRADRAAVCAAGARTVAVLLSPPTPSECGDDRQRSTVAAVVDGLSAIAVRLSAASTRNGPAGDRLAGAGEPESARAAAGALQAVVGQQEQAGAFLLAFSTLAAMRRALTPVLDARSRGLLLAQQGRVARQLGALAMAARFYRAAARAGHRAGAPDVVARALLGGGVLANMRGNYPKARTLFRRALRAASHAGSAVLRRSGHQGLLLAAFAANDADTALAHGWAAIRGLPEDAAEERAEMLLNLGEVGRQTGDHRAALGACLSAIELTDLPRLRLPALGTAARAAASLGEHRLLEFIARDVERTVARSGQQFENARTLVELAEAFDGYRNDAALCYAARAQSLAASGTFYEVATRAAHIIDGYVDADAGREHARDTAARSPRAQAVLRTLAAMPAAERYERLAAC
ncbi:hypothetical protein tb265_14720 [Gemmatimonadetes bacterium T265]|nr:hypothetical protein tb265_14720 [Gemmatimonadetes bacterium T265]